MISEGISLDVISYKSQKDKDNKQIHCENGSLGSIFLEISALHLLTMILQCYLLGDFWWEIREHTGGEKFQLYNNVD